MFENVCPSAVAMPTHRLLPVVVVIALASMFAYRISNNVADVDLWHEMALAREALAGGQVPWEDRFA